MADEEVQVIMILLVAVQQSLISCEGLMEPTMPTLSAPFFKTHRNISDPCGTISPVNSERQVWAEMSVVHSTHQLMIVSI